MIYEINYLVSKNARGEHKAYSVQFFADDHFPDKETLGIIFDKAREGPFECEDLAQFLANQTGCMVMCRQGLYTKYTKSPDGSTSPFEVVMWYI